LYTPFFAGIYKSSNLITRSEDLSKTYHNQVRLVPQILSKDADEIMRFAHFCSERGFDEINWNLGCPYPRVANKKRGSGMLPYPELVEEILSEVSDRLPLKLSVKCRLGYHDSSEIFNLIPKFNRFKISELIIHARYGKQLYKGDVDTNTFKKCIDLCERPLVYNGDIFSVEDLTKCKSEFSGVNRWMIGRGLLMDPFLPGDIKGTQISSGDRKLIVEKFVSDLYLAYRKHMNDRLQAINVMKELWGFLCYSFYQPDKAFNRIKKCKSFDTYEQAVSDIFKHHSWLGSEAKQFV
jgi:tRNA-dihydrouridine synthase